MKQSEVLQILADVWLDNPELRLGQLISGAIIPEMIYYMTDEQLTATIQDTFKHDNR